MARDAIGGARRLPFVPEAGRESVLDNHSSCAAEGARRATSLAMEIVYRIVHDSGDEQHGRSQGRKFTWTRLDDPEV